MASESVGERPPAPGSDLSSVDIVLEYARKDYEEHFTRLESLRSRAGTLLGFAAVVVGFSAAVADKPGSSVILDVGIVSLLVCAVLFILVFVAHHFRVAPLVEPLAEYYLSEPQDRTRA